jgi:hypothetical protein
MVELNASKRYCVIFMAFPPQFVATVIEAPFGLSRS